LGNKLLATIKENAPYPFKIKSGVSGCKMGCGLSFVRDIGLVGSAKGWELYFGGSAMSKANVGIQLGSELSEGQVLEMVGKALSYYKENGKKRERIGSMVQRIGHDVVAGALK